MDRGFHACRPPESIRRRRERSEAGAVSPVAFTLLAFLSIAVISAALLLVAVSGRISRLSESARQEQVLLRQAGKLMDLLSGDPTPGSDSLIDPVWTSLESADWEGCRVSLRDVSSRLNPNWVQRSLLSETELGTLLLPGKTPDDLQVFRDRAGFSLDVAEGYEEFFRPADAEALLTPYGYANVNVTDEFSLTALVRIRTGEEDLAEMFHQRLRTMVAGRISADRKQFRELLGSAWGRVYPVINTEPVYNVHFLPERILRAVLSYPAFAVSDHTAKASMLLSGRKGSEYTGEGLRGLIGALEVSRIHQYLGTVTWFWELRVETGGRVLRIVLARLPGGADPGERPEFRIVEKRMLE